MKNLAALIAIALIGCATQGGQAYKSWHQSPTDDPRSSTLYPLVPWDVLAQIKVGMSESQVAALIGSRPQYFHHPINAIVFSRTPEGRDVEVALKRSSNGAVEDLSYKLK